VEFNSHTNTMVGSAVAVVNLLTPGEERGRDYEPPAGAELAAGLNALFMSAGSRSRATPAQAAELGPVASGLRAVFTAVSDGDLDRAAGQVNAMLAHTGAHPELERHDGEPWHLHFHALGPASLAVNWAAGFAAALAVVLGGEYHDRLGVCTAPRCDRVYVDTSRNGSKRFCSTACQNRVKAAVFRERHATPPAPGNENKLPGIDGSS
jgi:predicted RNA-binding Zn ribbon-like protein